AGAVDAAALPLRPGHAPRVARTVPLVHSQPRRHGHSPPGPRKELSDGVTVSELEHPRGSAPLEQAVVAPAPLCRGGARRARTDGQPLLHEHVAAYAA